MEFKDLLDLFKKCKYEEVINEAKELKDFNSVFLVVRSLIALKKNYEALNYYYDNLDLLENANLIEAGKIYFYLLVKNKTVNKKIYDEIERFNGLQYRNQQTEEFLCELENYVNELQKQEEDSLNFSLEKIIKLLRSDDPNEVATAINNLVSNPDFSLINIGDLVGKILQERSDFDFVYGMLFDFLICVDSTDTFMFRKDGIYYKLTPHDLILKKAKQNKIIDQFLNKIISHEKDVVLSQYITSYVMQSLYCLVPNFIERIETLYSLIAAVYQVLGRALNIDYEENLNYKVMKLKSDQDEIAYFYRIILEYC